MIFVDQNCTSRLGVVFKSKVTGLPITDGSLAGSTFACDVRKSVDYPTVLFNPEIDETQLSTGYIYVTVLPEHTELMVNGAQYVMDLLIKLPGGDIYKVISTSTLSMRPTASRFAGG